MPNPFVDRLRSLSENDFRRDVLIPLLVATDGFSQVSDVHGTSERGLDIIFCTSDPVRKEIWYGLQLKKGDISGGGSRQQTVREIITQLGLAKDHRHKVAVGKAGEYVMDHYIVACSGKISQTARDEIASRMSPINVDFWDLSEIIRRAKSVMPELLQVADGELVLYLKRLAEVVDELDALDQVSGVAERRLSEVFVEPRVRRRLDPTAGGDGSHKAKDPTVAATELGSLETSVVLIGEQDEGKTAILRMIALRAATAILEGNHTDAEVQRVPVLIRAQEILSKGGVAGAAAGALRRLGATERCAELETTPASLTSYLVLVDGFSELHNNDEKSDCTDLIAAVSTDEGPPFVIAGRPDDFLSPRFFSSSQHYTIPPISSQDVGKLVRCWVKDYPAADVPTRLVERVREALQLPGSPIPAIIGVMMYEKEHRFITNTADAVDRYMVIRLGRYASEMGLPFEVDWARKQDLLGELAFAMVSDETNVMSRSEAEERLGQIYERLGEKDLSKVAVQELVDAGVLLESDDDIAFFRSAFRDFFAAHYVNNNPQTLDEFFEEHLFDRKWGHVLVFAAGLRRKNTELLGKLNAKVVKERDQLSLSNHEDYLYGAYLIGRILSNSEYSDATPRLQVLKTTTAAARESADLLAREAVEQFGPIGEVISLVGTEQTLFVSVGVPWLEHQIHELAVDEDLNEEERYLLASIYAQLACEGWIDVLTRMAKAARSPRVVAALTIAAHLIESQRSIGRDSKASWKAFKRELERGRSRLGTAFDKAFELKDRLLEIERERVRRLVGKERRAKGSD